MKITSREFAYNFEKSYHLTRKTQYRYQVVRKLVSKGTYGLVYLAKDTKLDKIVVIKMILCESFGTGDIDGLNQNLFESCVSLKLDHLNIVKAIDVYFDIRAESSAYLHIVMPYYDEGDLTSYLRKNPEISYKKMLNIAHQISLGLEYLHSHNIIHRDLKLDNIFVSNDGSDHIGDFGLVHEMDDVQLTQGCGTVGFMSPEVQNVKEYSFSTDIFSFGATLVFLFTRTILWKKFNVQEEKEALEWLNVQMDLVAFDVKELMIRLMDFNANRRPNANECRIHIENLLHKQ
jgi:serine/threonine protein kinase